MGGKGKNLTVFLEYEFETIQKKDNIVTGASFRNKENTEAIKVKAGVTIDATELGDVLAAAGAAYDLGMDDPAISGEKEARQKRYYTRPYLGCYTERLWQGCG